MKQHKNYNINKRVPGVLKDKIWATDAYWERDTEVIDAFANSEIFPECKS